MGLCYPYSESKGADQLRGYGEADLHLCFRICKKPVFLQGSYMPVTIGLLGTLEVVYIQAFILFSVSLQLNVSE